MSKKGIDVSYHQGVIDWKKVKAAGVELAIIRAGYGRLTSQQDKQFSNNYTNAKASGIPLGTYWYSYASDVAGAKAEAQACIAILKGKSFEYPVFFDIEEKSLEKASRKNTNTEMCIAFCDALAAAGYKVGVYANKNWWTNFISYSTLKNKGYVIWLAQYNNTMTYNSSVDIWQYSSSGRVNGISGNVDMNYCYLSVGNNNNSSGNSNSNSGSAGSGSGSGSNNGSGSETYTNYTIKSGDTLSHIAAKYGTTVTAIMAANSSIKDKNKIYAGTVIKIPKLSSGGSGGGSVSWTPAKGDKVIVNGKIYGNGNGSGGSLSKSKSTMYVVDLVSSKTYKHFIGVAATKTGARQGWGDLSTISKA